MASSSVSAPAIRFGALATALLALWLLGAAPAAAQSPFQDFGLGRPTAEPEAAPPERDRPPDLQAYGEIAETYRASSALDATERRIGQFRERLRDTLARAPDMDDDIREALVRAAPNGEPAYFAGLAAFLALLLGIGRAPALIFAVYVARPIFVSMQRPNPVGLAEKLPVLATRVLFVVIGATIAIVVASVVGAGFYPEDHPAAVVTTLIVFGAFAAFRIADTVWRMVLAPYLPAYRIPAMTDREATRLYRWLFAITLFGVVAGALMLWLDQLGLRPESSALLHIGVTAVEIVAVLAGGWANRRAIAHAIAGDREPGRSSWLSRGAATLWYPALAVYLLFAWLELARRMVLGFQERPAPPLLVVGSVALAAIGVYALIVLAVELTSRRVRARRAAAAAADDAWRAEAAEGQGALSLRDPGADGPTSGGDFDGGDGDGEEGGGRAPVAPRAVAGPRAPHALRTFEDLARRVASLFALGCGAWAMIVLTGGRDLFANGSPLDRAQDVIDLLFVGYVIYHALRIWIDQRIEEEGGDEIEMEPGDEGGGASAASRLATLLPLVRNFVLILVIISTGVFVAMELGVNVAPLLGGAGILGLAIGFGSQTLIRDILSGAFFLIDDAFRKGEYIDIGEVKGTVEKISLRSFQLRHHLGALNTVPFGEVKYLTNFSRDWVMMKLPLRLTYDTDPEKVRKLIKNLGQELLKHPTEGCKFIQPLKSQGVYMMEDSAMIIRVKYMTKPGDQWTTRKLVYSSIRELFAREGVKFAHREVTVRIPELEGQSAQGLNEAEMRAIGAAARRVVDDVDEAQGPRPVAVGDDR